MAIDVRQSQLFVDDEIIQSQTLLERVVHQPTRYSENPILRPEMPWEIPTLSFVAGVYAGPGASATTAGPCYLRLMRGSEATDSIERNPQPRCHFVGPGIETEGNVVAG